MTVSQLGGPPSGTSSRGLPLYGSLKLPAPANCGCAGLSLPRLAAALALGPSRRNKKGREEKGEGKNVDCICLPMTVLIN